MRLDNKLVALVVVLFNLSGYSYADTIQTYLFNDISSHSSILNLGNVKDLEIVGDASIKEFDRPLIGSGESVVFKDSMHLKDGSFFGENVSVNLGAHIVIAKDYKFSTKNLEIHGVLEVENLIVRKLRIFPGGSLRVKNLIIENPSEEAFSLQADGRLEAETISVNSKNISIFGHMKVSHKMILDASEIEIGGDIESEELIVKAKNLLLQNLKLNTFEIRIALLGNLKIINSHLDSRVLSIVGNYISIKYSQFDTDVVRFVAESILHRNSEFSSNVFSVYAKVFGSRSVRFSSIAKSTHYFIKVPKFEMKNMDWVLGEVKDTEFSKAARIWEQQNWNLEDNVRSQMNIDTSSMISFDVPLLFEAINIKTDDDFFSPYESTFIHDVNLDVSARDIVIANPISGNQVSLIAGRNLSLNRYSPIRAGKLKLAAEKVDLYNDIQAEELELISKKYIMIRSGSIDSVKASLVANKSISIRKASLLWVLDNLQITNKEAVIKIDTNIISKSVDILGSELRMNKCAGVIDIDQFRAKVTNNILLENSFSTSKSGVVSVDAKNVSLYNVKMQARMGDDTSQLKVRSSNELRVNSSEIGNFQSVELDAEKLISLDKKSNIENIDSIQIKSSEVILDGSVEANHNLTIYADNLVIGNKVYSKGDTTLIVSNLLDIQSYAQLMVANNLKIDGKSKVSISGKVLAKILDVCSLEFDLLRSGKLDIENQAAIYSYAWQKISGIVNFKTANAKLVAGESIVIDGDMVYSNLSLEGIEGSKPDIKILSSANMVAESNEEKKSIQIVRLHKNVRNRNKDKDEYQIIASIVEEKINAPGWDDSILPKLKLIMSEQIIPLYIEKVRSNYMSFLVDMMKDRGNSGDLDFSLEQFKDTAKKLSGASFLDVKENLGEKLNINNISSSIKKMESKQVLSLVLKSAGFLGRMGVEQTAIMMTEKVLLKAETVIWTSVQLAVKRSLGLISEKTFTREFATNLRKHDLSWVNSRVLEILGVDLKSEGKKTDIRYFRNAGDRHPRRGGSNLSISGGDVYIDSNLSVDSLNINGKHVKINSYLSASAIEISSEYTSLLRSGTLSFEDHCFIEAQKKAFLYGRILTKNSDGKLVVNETAHNAFLYIKAKSLVSTTGINVKGNIEISASEDAIFHNGAKIKADQLKIDAKNIKINAPVEVEEAFYSAYEKLTFGSMDYHIVRNYLKIYAPTGKVEINAKILAKTVDICAEEFFLLRSGVLSVKDHAVLETKVHAVLDGVIKGNGDVSIQGKSADVEITNAIDIKGNLNILASQLKTFRESKHGKSKISAENIQIESEKVSFSGVDVSNEGIANIKGKSFELIANSSLNGERLNLDFEEDVYVGPLNSMKAAAINIKSAIFTNMQFSMIQSNQLSIQSDQQRVMGFMMAENMILSSKLFTMGLGGTVLGGNIAISAHGAQIGAGTSITGVNTSIAATANITTGFGSSIVGASNCNLTSASLCVLPGTFIGGARVNLFAPVVFVAPYSLIAGGLSVSTAGVSLGGSANIVSGDRLNLDFFGGEVGNITKSSCTLAQKINRHLDSLSNFSILKMVKNNVETCKVNKRTGNKEINVIGNLTIHGSVRSNDGVSIHAGTLNVSESRAISGQNVQIHIDALSQIDGKITAKETLFLDGDGNAKFHVSESGEVDAKELYVENTKSFENNGTVKTQSGKIVVDTYTSGDLSRVDLKEGGGNFRVDAAELNVSGETTGNREGIQGFIFNQTDKSRSFDFGMLNNGSARMAVVSEDGDIVLKGNDKVGGGRHFSIDAKSVSAPDGATQFAREMVSSNVDEKITHPQMANQIVNTGKGDFVVDNHKTITGTKGFVLETARDGKDIVVKGTIEGSKDANIFIGSETTKNVDIRGLKIDGPIASNIMSRNGVHIDGLASSGQLYVDTSGDIIVSRTKNLVNGDVSLKSANDIRIDGLIVDGKLHAENTKGSVEIDNMTGGRGIVVKSNGDILVKNSKSSKIISAYSTGERSKVQLDRNTTRDLEAFGVDATVAKENVFSGDARIGYLAPLGHGEVSISKNVQLESNKYVGTGEDVVSIAGENVTEIKSKNFDSAKEVNTYSKNEVNIDLEASQNGKNRFVDSAVSRHVKGGESVEVHRSYFSSAPKFEIDENGNFRREELSADLKSLRDREEKAIGDIDAGFRKSKLLAFRQSGLKIIDVSGDEVRQEQGLDVDIRSIVDILQIDAKKVFLDDTLQADHLKIHSPDLQIDGSVRSHIFEYLNKGAIRGNGSIDADLVSMDVSEFLFGGSIQSDNTTIRADKWGSEGNNAEILNHDSLRIYLDGDASEFSPENIKSNKVLIQGELKEDQLRKLISKEVDGISADEVEIVLANALVLSGDYVLKPNLTLETASLYLEEDTDVVHQGLKIKSRGDILGAMGTNIVGGEGDSLDISAESNIYLGLKKHKGEYMNYESYQDTFIQDYENKLKTAFDKYENEIATRKRNLNKAKSQCKSVAKKSSWWARKLFAGGVNAIIGFGDLFSSKVKMDNVESPTIEPPKVTKIYGGETSISGENVSLHGVKIDSNQSTIVLKYEKSIVVVPIISYTRSIERVKKDAGLMEQVYSRETETEIRSEFRGKKVTFQKDKECDEGNSKLVNVNIRSADVDLGGLTVENRVLKNTRTKIGKKTFTKSGRRALSAVRAGTSKVCNKAGPLGSVIGIGLNMMIDYGVNQAEARGTFAWDKSLENNSKSALINEIVQLRMDGAGVDEIAEAFMEVGANNPILQEGVRSVLESGIKVVLHAGYDATKDGRFESFKDLDQKVGHEFAVGLFQAGFAKLNADLDFKFNSEEALLDDLVGGLAKKAFVRISSDLLEKGDISLDGIRDDVVDVVAGVVVDEWMRTELENPGGKFDDSVDSMEMPVFPNEALDDDSRVLDTISEEVELPQFQEEFLNAEDTEDPPVHIAESVCKNNIAQSEELEYVSSQPVSRNVDSESIHEDATYIDMPQQVIEPEKLDYLDLACFVEDTQVLTIDGWKAIQDIQIDDEIVSCSHTEGRCEIKPVTKLFKRTVDELAYVTVQDDVGDRDVLVSSTNHPYYVANKGVYKAASDLSVYDTYSYGDILLSEEFAEQFVVGKEIHKVEETSVYNISVRGNENYYVSNSCKKGILVHNCTIADVSLDFMPVIGGLKGSVEASLGYNTLGEELSVKERANAALGIIPGAAGIKNVGKIGKIAKAIGTLVNKRGLFEAGAGYDIYGDELSFSDRLMRVGAGGLGFIPSPGKHKIVSGKKDGFRKSGNSNSGTGFKGQKGHELKNAPYQKTRNKPANIGGRDYSGHSLDQMQNRGLPPSVVENTIKTGQKFPGNKPNTVGYYDPANKVRVITNSETGNVITIIPGGPK